MEELERYSQLLRQPTGTIPEQTLGRMQRMTADYHPSWIPTHCRDITEVKMLYGRVISAIQSKKQLLLQRCPSLQNVSKIFSWSDNELLTYCKILQDERVPGADALYKDLKRDIEQGKLWEGQKSGYKFQIHQSLKGLYELKIIHVERPYGTPNPDTMRQGRSDATFVDGYTQSPQPHYYPSQEERRTVTDLDYKMGYQDPKHQEELLGQFNKYGGNATSEKNITYGGIENRLEYLWYQKAPKDFITNAQQTVSNIRQSNPKAFPFGAYVKTIKEGDNYTLAEPLQSGEQEKEQHTSQTTSQTAENLSKKRKRQEEEEKAMKENERQEREAQQIWNHWQDTYQHNAQFEDAVEWKEAKAHQSYEEWKKEMLEYIQLYCSEDYPGEEIV
ncbi:hypothetical protein LOK74_08405 [Brevibacillus humidisoli]|uniref:hypothetical protein n=1 Tax=Brevibacillus humidisoli TaxID=2895522 RepID=UPI001E29BD1F|nr:hypothetical protein [Brevibacillus humidisoli]UFJ42496.1 hypothetical protein LOK74_08405 [Brevibacillus humidisoli]